MSFHSHFSFLPTNSFHKVIFYNFAAMKTTRLLILIIILFMHIPGMRGVGRSVASEEEIRNLLVESPDSVLLILDKIESEKKSSLPSYKISLLRSLAYNEKRMFSLVEKYAREVLSDDSISHHDKERLNALTLLSTAQAYYGNFQGSIASSTEAMKIARKLNNEAALFNILTTMSKTSFAMGDRKQGYQYLDRIISEGSNSKNVRTLANVSAAYGVKIVELYTDEKFNEGLEEGRKRLDIIERIDKLGGAPEGFTDQQRAYAYARIASCAERAGKRDEAKDAYNKFMATDYASSPIGRAYIMDYLLDSSNWKTVMDFTAPLYPILAKGDTINDDYRSLLESDSKALAGLGRFREAYSLAQRAALIKDSLTARENNLRTQEMASLFSLNEKEMELLNMKVSLQKKHIWMISAIGIGILVILILLILWRAYRSSVRQQKIAAKRVDQLLELNKMDFDFSEGNEEDFETFTKMQHTLMSDNLFKDQNFNRDSIAEVCGLSRARIVALIDKFTGLNPNDYINKLRVEYSVKLIQEHPDWTIDAIAVECGYVRRATYYSHFNKVFGITPAQYRKNMNI